MPGYHWHWDESREWIYLSDWCLHKTHGQQLWMHMLSWVRTQSSKSKGDMPRSTISTYFCQLSLSGQFSDINECLNDTHTCQLTISTCRNTVGSFSCDCKPGYENLPTDSKTCVGQFSIFSKLFICAIHWLHEWISLQKSTNVLNHRISVKKQNWAKQQLQQA